MSRLVYSTISYINNITHLIANMSEQNGSKEGQVPLKMNDSIHGHMQLEPLLFRIIDTPEFQRLRNIKQLGPTSLVYPSAAHSRFEHSVGVCHLASEMLNNLEMHTEGLIISEKHKLCVKVAALCHDLGHGPLSHSWEIFVKRQQPQENWTHEQASVSMLKKLLKNIKHKLSNDDIQMIENLIKGFDKDSKFLVKPEHHFLYEIVNNKYCDMDVDKWDYLLRDSKYANIPTGFDYKRLLSGVRVVTNNIDGATHISYRDLDAINVYRMYMDRANLHYYCYKHRASIMAEEMYFDALALAENEKELEIVVKEEVQCEKYKLSTAHRNMAAYEQLTDSIIEKTFWSSCKEAKLLLKRILIRDFYKVVYSRKINDAKMLEQITNSKSKLLVDLASQFQMDFGMCTKTMAMGNNGKLKNTPFHNKYGEKVIEQDLQIFSQSGRPEKFWYGEIIIYSKANNMINLNYDGIAKEAKKYIDIITNEF